MGPPFWEPFAGCFPVDGLYGQGLPACKAVFAR